MQNHCLKNIKVSKSGLTIIELIIAISLAAILLSSLYYFWNYLNRHTTTYTRSALFSTEAHRIINSLGSQIKNAEKILSYNLTSIQFISKNGDTLHYEFNGDSLFLNEKPLTLISKGANITNFEIRNLNEDDYRETLFTLIELSISMGNGFGDTSSIVRSVRAPKPQEEYDSW